LRDELRPSSGSSTISGRLGGRPRNPRRQSWRLGGAEDLLPSDVKAMVIRRVATFSEFSADNDPHGEHDFGSFDLGGRKFFGKLMRTTPTCSSARRTRPIPQRPRASLPSCSRGSIEAVPCPALAQAGRGFLINDARDVRRRRVPRHHGRRESVRRGGGSILISPGLLTGEQRLYPIVLSSPATDQTCSVLGAGVQPNRQSLSGFNISPCLRDIDLDPIA